jgi:hypothetical protein
MISNNGALLISLSVGLFGFKESISASYVVQSLAVETITLLALLSWTVLAAARPAVGLSSRSHGSSRLRFRGANDRHLGPRRLRPAIITAAERHVRPHIAPPRHASKVLPKQ